MPAAGAGMAFAGTPGRRAALTDKGFDVLDSQAIQLMYQALWLVLLLSAPPVLAAALVGLVIALIQAATQIQEQTLQYALKFFAIVVTIFITASLLGGSLYQFADRPGIAGTYLQSCRIRIDGRGDDDQGNASLEGTLILPLQVEIEDEAPSTPSRSFSRLEMARGVPFFKSVKLGKVCTTLPPPA